MKDMTLFSTLFIHRKLTNFAHLKGISDQYLLWLKSLHNQGIPLNKITKTRVNFNAFILDQFRKIEFLISET